MKMRQRKLLQDAKYSPEPWTYIEHNGMIVGGSVSFWKGLLSDNHRVVNIDYARAEEYLGKTQDDWLEVVNRHKGVIS